MISIADSRIRRLFDITGTLQLTFFNSGFEIRSAIVTRMIGSMRARNRRAGSVVLLIK